MLKCVDGPQYPVGELCCKKNIWNMDYSELNDMFERKRNKTFQIIFIQNQKQRHVNKKN